MMNIVRRLLSVITLSVSRRGKLIPRYRTIVKSAFFDQTTHKNNQNDAAEQLLTFCNNNVEFYKDMLKCNISLGSSEWLAIPAVTKQMIIANPELFIAKGVDPKKVGWNATSGSTGHNFQFLYDRDATIWSEAGVLFTWNLMDISLGSKEFTVWGAIRDVRNRDVYSNLKLILKNKYIEVCYNISAEKAKSILQRIGKSQPTVICGYPTILDQLVRYDVTGTMCTSEIICAGEWLRPDIRNRIENHVGKHNLFDRYGSREFGVIACECSHHNGLHIISPLVYVEVLDEYDNPCPPDTEGELVITSFTRRTMPFLRYKIGDRGILSSKPCSCGCGFPLIKELKGRSMDLIKGKNGSSFSGYFWTHISRDIEGVKEFCVVQDKIGHVTVEIIPEKHAPKNLPEKLKDLLNNETNGELDISVKIVESLKYGKTGKLKFIESRI